MPTSLGISMTQITESIFLKQLGRYEIDTTRIKTSHAKVNYSQITPTPQ